MLTKPCSGCRYQCTVAAICSSVLLDSVRVTMMPILWPIKCDRHGGKRELGATQSVATGSCK
jgi:membrane-bound metal-dependent hydrolase YbcI (DUF457 family)